MRGVERVGATGVKRPTSAPSSSAGPVTSRPGSRSISTTIEVGGGVALLGPSAHRVGDRGKAAARCAGVCGPGCRVLGEKVGLMTAILLVVATIASIAV